MEYRRFKDTIVARLDRGEEILAQVKEITLKEEIKLASVQALGAMNKFTVGVFKTDEKEYLANEFCGSFEIVSLTGTVNTMNDEFIRLQFTDMFGTLKNVAVPVSCLEKAMDDRSAIDLASLNGFAKERRQSCISSRIFSRFTILPWRLRMEKFARFLCDVCTEDEREYELSPRLIRETALEKAEKQG